MESGLAHILGESDSFGLRVLFEIARIGKWLPLTLGLMLYLLGAWYAKDSRKKGDSRPPSSAQTCQESRTPTRPVKALHKWPPHSATPPLRQLASGAPQDTLRTASL